MIYGTKTGGKYFYESFKKSSSFPLLTNPTKGDETHCSNGSIRKTAQWYRSVHLYIYVHTYIHTYIHKYTLHT